MAIPEAVRKMGEAADAMQSKLAMAEPETPEAVEVESPEQEVADGPATPELLSMLPPDDSDEGEQDTLLASDDDLVVEDMGDESVSKAEYDKLLQKYRTLQGKWDKEVAPMRERLTFLEQYVREIQNELVVARSATPSPGTSPQGEAPSFDLSDLSPTDLGISEEELDQYGPEYFDMLKRMSGSIAQRMVAPVIGKVQQVESKAQTVSVAALYAEMDGLLPGWRELDNRNDWKRWCLEEDPVTGVVRQAYISQLIQQGNAPKLVGIMREFIRQRSAQGAGNNGTAKVVPLSTQVTPNRRTAPVDAPKKAKGKVFTRKEINDFFTAKAGRRLLMTPDEAARYEMEINKAVAEGRVQ